MNSIFKILLAIFGAFVFLLGGVLVILYFFFWSKSETTELNSNKPMEQISNIAKTPSPKPKGERDAKLQRETDALLPLFRMPSVPIYLTNETIEKGEEGKEGGVAYNVCERDNPTIYMKKAFYNKGNRKQIVNILKHELTHAYFCRQGIQAGHDERFREKFTQVGGFGN